MKRFFVLFVSLLFTFNAGATVNVKTQRVQYNCNGSTNTYAYPFQIFKDNDLVEVDADKGIVRKIE